MLKAYYFASEVETNENQDDEIALIQLYGRKLFGEYPFEDNEGEERRAIQNSRR